MFVSHPFQINPQDDIIWRWGPWEVIRHECEAPVNETSTLKKKDPRGLLPPSAM